MIRLVLPSLALLALPACTAREAQPRPDLPGQTPAAYASSPASRAGAPSGAAVLAPEAGAVERVGERRIRGGIVQEIALAADGAAGRGNRIDVTLMTGEAGSLDDEPSGPAKPSEAGIRAELKARFPGTAMQVVGQPRRNAYGPFGLAVGRAEGGARCLYAWQWIGSLSGSAAARDPVSLRVRLCRSDLTLDQLAALVEGIRLEPRDASGGGGGGGLEALVARQPSVPRPRAGHAGPARTAERRPWRPPVAEPAGQPRTAPVFADRGAGDAVGADGRRYLATPASVPSRQAAAFGPAVAGPSRPAGAAPRGFYDRSPARSAEAGPVTQPAPSRAAVLDPSLPAQAYLGPSAARAAP